MYGLDIVSHWDLCFIPDSLAFINLTDVASAMTDYRISVFIFSMLFLLGCEPIGPVPGAKLTGTITSVPEDWRLLNAAEVIQLATFDDYSVNLWGVGTETGYYLASSRGAGSKWAARISKDANVRLRIEGNIYLLRAVEVTESNELESVRKAFKSKYNLDADEDFPEAVVYRMDSRD